MTFFVPLLVTQFWQNAWEDFISERCQLQMMITIKNTHLEVRFFFIILTQFIQYVICIQNDPPSIDAGRLMPVSLMPITFMPVTIDAQEAFLMPVTIDAGHYWCPWGSFDASHHWCPSLLMPVTIDARHCWCHKSLLMPVTIDARHYWCPLLLMPVL